MVHIRFPTGIIPTRMVVTVLLIVSCASIDVVSLLLLHVCAFRLNSTELGVFLAFGRASPARGQARGDGHRGRKNARGHASLLP